MKDVKGWLEKARQSLESPQNKKKPLRDQHAIREKMLSDVGIQKTKIQMSVEKLQVHFRAGMGGDNRVVESSDELITELDAHNDVVKEQTISLEVCLAQLDQYQQVRLRKDCKRGDFCRSCSSNIQGRVRFISNVFTKNQ